MNEISSPREAYLAAVEVLSAFVDEDEKGAGHSLSTELLMSYAPAPLPPKMRNLVVLAAQAFSLLAISVRAQAFLASGRDEEVSVHDIIDLLGASLERGS